MRTLGFRGKKSRLCRGWGTRRNLVWGKLGKGETIRGLRKIQGFISREWVKILLRRTTSGYMAQFESLGISVSAPFWWPSFTWLQGARCLGPVGPYSHHLSSWNWSHSWASKVTPKIQIPELFGAPGQPLRLGVFWGVWCWKVPQIIEMGTRIHTNRGLALSPMHRMGTRKFWGRCYKERGSVGPSFPALLAQVQGWYLT